MGYIFIGDPEENAAQAEAYVKRGYRELKLKVGREPDVDVARVKLVRETVGPDIRIRVDANMAWNQVTAVKIIRRMEPWNIQYVEQPVPFRDHAGMAWVRARVETPVAADESCTSISTALSLIRHRACDVFVVYVSEAGGLTKAREIVRLADNEGIHCVLGTWAELGIGTTAGMHLIASSRNFPFANDTHYELQDGDIITHPLQIIDGITQLPEGPGLGVAIDPDRLKTFADLHARETVFGDAKNPEFIPRVGRIL
ncbi:MAG: hypothetical protein IIB54_15295 [Planctomycetes bacterium]|nr:hypothetical protein [Planctomycetota bacterium]